MKVAPVATLKPPRTRTVPVPIRANPPAGPIGARFSPRSQHSSEHPLSFQGRGIPWEGRDGY